MNAYDQIMKALESLSVELDAWERYLNCWGNPAHDIWDL